MKATTSFIGIKVDGDLHEAIKAKAQLEQMSVSDLLRRAIVEYMNRDINVSNEILGTLEQLNKNVKKCNDQYVLFH
jgi:division protein CdvB (Snf7/Vps24/ESCRT-III family)